VRVGGGPGDAAGIRRAGTRVGRVGPRPARSAGRRLPPSLVGRLGGAPVDVIAAAGVDAAHVDALDRAGLGALEAGLALERAPLVVQQLQAAAVLGRDVGVLLRPHDRGLGREETPLGHAYAAGNGHTLAQVLPCSPDIT